MIVLIGYILLFLLVGLVLFKMGVCGLDDLFIISSFITLILFVGIKCINVETEKEVYKTSEIVKIVDKDRVLTMDGLKDLPKNMLIDDLLEITKKPEKANLTEYKNKPKNLIVKLFILSDYTTEVTFDKW